MPQNDANFGFGTLANADRARRVRGADRPRACGRRQTSSARGRLLVRAAGEGCVAAAIDARSFRREVRLAGIEPVSSATARKDRAAALAAVAAGRDVTLHGQDDAPDRYGRQLAFVYLAGTETLVQGGS
jgi:hypothetical protein